MSEYDGVEETGKFKYWAQYSTNSVKRRWDKGAIFRRPKELLIHGAAKISHEPLPRSTWIRLLTIEPGRPSDVIRCNISITDLDQKPIYTALSYTWKEDPSIVGALKTMAADGFKQMLRGDYVQIELPEDTGDATESRTIFCNGKPTKTFPNLYAALVQLRQRKPTQYWIDALCIDQSNLQERTAQVHLMGRIYQSADFVIVWLGSSTQLGTLGIPNLEALADRKGGLPDLRLLYDDSDKIIIPPGMDLDAKFLYDAVTSASAVVMSQWFRRTWVVQELCLAKEVIFAMDNSVISSRALLTAFQLASHRCALGISERLDRNLGQSCSLRFSMVPLTIQARDTFRNGEMWTLKEWLWACKGRTATDPRDMIFGGLALIEPERLRIDRTIQLMKRRPVHSSYQPALPFRHYYPQIIPPQGMRMNIPITTEQPHEEAAALTPRGLWPSLTADYTVDAADVFVNTAACLLSHTGTSEILSIASRIRRPATYISKWRFAPNDKFDVHGLPSWVPMPGSWTSRMTQNLAFRSSSGFAAGRPMKNSPRISHDGRALHLEASRFDEVHDFILDSDSIATLEIDELKQLLSNIKDLDTYCQGSNLSTFSTLSHVMVSGRLQESPGVATDASKWLCSTLTSAVIKTICKNRMTEIVKRPRRYKYSTLSSDAFSDWLSQQPEQKQNDLDKLLELYDEAKIKHPNKEWPEFSPRSMDLMIHKLVLEEFAKAGHSLDNTAVSADSSSSLYEVSTNLTLEKLEATLKNFVKSKNNFSANPSTVDLATLYERAMNRSLENLDETLKNLVKSQNTFSTDNPELHNAADDAASAALSFRKVFITKRGYIGLGPKWINKGDTIMLVHGAPVPFIFTRLESDLRREEIELRNALDATIMSYNRTIDNKQKNKMTIIDPRTILQHKRWDGKLKKRLEEYGELKSDLERVTAEIGKNDGWVLLGEAYVEGIMQGQAADIFPTEKIVVY